MAVFYGLFNDSRLAYFNGGFDQQYNKFSLGTLLVKKLIDFGIKNGMTVFDFLRGNEAYKSKWTKQFDWNRTVYLSHSSWLSKVLVYKQFLSDTRLRVGGRKAITQLISALKSSNQLYHI